jgi:CheY-like chemotaxis protein
VSQASGGSRSYRLNRGGVIRVLLVDDVQIVRQALRGILGSYPGFEVVGEACNGEEALESVQILKPSVVVMDINMPKLDGIRATSLIKRVYPHIVIVGLSVYANEDTRKAMTAAGATTVISKEAAVEQLRDEIIESVNRRSGSLVGAFHSKVSAKRNYELQSCFSDLLEISRSQLGRGRNHFLFLVRCLTCETWVGPFACVKSFPACPTTPRIQSKQAAEEVRTAVTSSPVAYR